MTRKGMLRAAVIRESCIGKRSRREHVSAAFCLSFPWGRGIAFSMHTVSLEEAKRQLDELVAEAGRGGEIIITQNEKPVAKLAPTSSAGVSGENGDAALIGFLKGKITLKEGWDEPLDEMRPYME